MQFPDNSIRDNRRHNLNSVERRIDRHGIRRYAISARTLQILRDPTLGD
jgi:hypothetical protein